MVVDGGEGGWERKRLTARVTCLENIESASHISFRKLHKCIGGFRGDVDFLLLDDLVHQDPDILLLQRTEPEPRTSRQQRWAQLMRVIRNEAESRIGRVLLHDPSECHLTT